MNLNTRPKTYWSILKRLLAFHLFIYLVVFLGGDINETTTGTPVFYFTFTVTLLLDIYISLINVKLKGLQVSAFYFWDFF